MIARADHLDGFSIRNFPCGTTVFAAIRFDLTMPLPRRTGFSDPTGMNGNDGQPGRHACHQTNHQPHREVMGTQRHSNIFQIVFGFQYPADGWFHFFGGL
ncbi:MAG: hypothetical protein KDA89_07210 [Planctomycetaceae bacterium]|nr:hypothetical protein [Planctomycetaceae bacterium]